MAPVLLRMSRLNVLDRDPQPQPPHRKPGELKEPMRGSEGNAVIGADGPRQTTLCEKTFKGPESQCFPVGLPDRDTRYTLTAEDAYGHTATESFVLQVK
jgi:hypothetical protein